MFYSLGSSPILQRSPLCSVHRGRAQPQRQPVPECSCVQRSISVYDIGLAVSHTGVQPLRSLECLNQALILLPLQPPRGFCGLFQHRLAGLGRAFRTPLRAGLGCLAIRIALPTLLPPSPRLPGAPTSFASAPTRILARACTRVCAPLVGFDALARTASPCVRRPAEAGTSLCRDLGSWLRLSLPVVLAAVGSRSSAALRARRRTSARAPAKILLDFAVACGGWENVLHSLWCPWLRRHVVFQVVLCLLA